MPGNGGAISLEAANDINITGGLDSSSYSLFGNAGNGGAINIEAANDINITGSLDSSSNFGEGNARNGGNISLTTANGTITITSLLSLMVMNTLSQLMPLALMVVTLP
jgi:hypothetical protein